MRRRTLAIGLAGLAMAGLALWGCDRGGYAVLLSFAPATLGAEVVHVEVALVADCGDQPLASGGQPVDPRRVVEVRRDEQAADLGAVAPGRHGLYARAWSADCRVMAAGCSPVTVEEGGTGTLEVVLAAVDGPGCDPGQSCQDGACVAPDAGPCLPECPDCEAECGGDTCRCADGCACHFTCASGADCGVECVGAGTECQVDAAGAANLDPFVCSDGATCFVDFDGGSNMNATARCHDAGTSCEVSCEGASNCSISCNHNAQCLLRCADASNCRFAPCTGGESDCGGGVIVCNRTCP